MHIPFQHSYAQLPARFFARVMPTAVKAPRAIRCNRALAEQLGLDLDWLATQDAADVFAGARVADGSLPIALAYAGHQFGNFVPQLGDGRAILLGELIDRSGVRRDVQLKGSGPTPYSRRGDGRAALGPVLREYVVSEAMAAMGVPTTRSLAAVATGEYVFRESALPGAVLTRVAASHIRVGTFQFFAARRDREGLAQLVAHVVARHYPEHEKLEKPALPLLRSVVQKQAALVAQWLSIGFIHGVMNTDNMTVSGETIDYGPCAFMDEYHPSKVFSSIDHNGRYAYANQPPIAQWNLARLGETLLPLIDDDEDIALAQAEAALSTFADIFESELATRLRNKLGLVTEQDGDLELALDFLKLMAAQRADFTLTYRALADAVVDETALRQRFSDPAAIEPWLTRWRARLSAEPIAAHERQRVVRSASPAIIPRNHQIEAVIASAVREGDFEPFHALVDALSDPYAVAAESSPYAAPPREEERVRETFCGT